MYLKMRTDVHVAPRPHDVLIHVGGQQARVQGAAAGPLLDRLRPLLDGQHDLGPVLAQLPPGQRRVVDEVLTALTACGALRDTTVDRCVPLPEGDERTHAATLDYLETLTDQARAAFARVRRASVVVVGAASAARVVAPTLWDAGVGRGVVALTGDHHGFSAVLRTALAQRERNDPQLAWTVQACALDVEHTDLVVAVGDRQMVATWAAWCAARHVPLLPVLLGQRQATIGPLCAPDTHLGEEFLARVDLATPGPDTATAWAYVGARAAVEAFKVLAGVPGLGARQLVSIDAAQLSDAAHEVPRTGRSTPSPEPDVVARRLAGEGLAGQDLPAGVIDSLTGWVESAGPEDAPQLPVPLLVTRRRGGAPLLTSGLDLGAARVSGVAAALAAALPSTPGPADLRFAWDSSGTVTSRMWPDLAWRRVAAPSLTLALADALRAQVQAQPGVCASLPAVQAALTENAAFDWRALTLRYGHAVAVYTREAGGVHGVTVCASSARAEALGPTLPGALEAALRHVLAQVQAGSEWTAPGGAVWSEPVTGGDDHAWQEVLRGLRSPLALALSSEHLPLLDAGWVVGWVAHPADQ